MWYVERQDDRGEWTTLMAAPHRVGVTDLHGPPGPHSISHTGGGDLHASVPTPGQKTHFAGKRGWKARVRWNDTLVELFDWDKIPDNEFDPDSDYLWGWKLVVDNKGCVPFEVLHPLSFVG